MLEPAWLVELARAVLETAYGILEFATAVVVPAYEILEFSLLSFCLGRGSALVLLLECLSCSGRLFSSFLASGRRSSAPTKYLKNN